MGALTLRTLRLRRQLLRGEDLQVDKELGLYGNGLRTNFLVIGPTLFTRVVNTPDDYASGCG
jgi:hypothetical protein